MECRLTGDVIDEKTAARLLEAGLYTFIFTWFDEDANCWRPDALQPPLPNPLELATELFWLDRDPKIVKLAAVLEGQVATVDDYDYAHEPEFDEDWFEQYQSAANKQRRRRNQGKSHTLMDFTVYGVWRAGLDTEYKRWCKYMEALDWQHAMLLARNETDSGEFLICGVVNDRVPPVDRADHYVYATPDGQLPEQETTPEPEAKHHKRGWF